MCSRAVVASLAHALAALLVVSAGCRSASVTPTRPNVVVYLVDTLRPDHLGVYGYERDTSPALDAFARDAVVFDQAYSPSAWTRPACASLLTGLNPQKHRAITRDDTLGAEVELLSEYLQALERIGDGRATKLVIPAEFSGLLGTVAALAAAAGDDDTDDEVRPREGLPIPEEDERVELPEPDRSETRTS